ncbi:MAG: glutathione S-transferase family protein [Hyphomicrobiales bacterium]
MKIIEDKRAPNPRRVRIFLAEKNIEVACEQLDIMREEHHSDAIKSLNPMQRIPILVLDDGEVISESIAICRYFEALHPTPALMGSTPLEIARIEMWQRRVELLLLQSIAHVLRHTNEAMAALEHPQVPEWGEVNRPKVVNMLKFLNTDMETREFVAGDTYSVADITALVAIDFMRVIKLNLDGLENLQRWHASVSARPSAKA